MKTAGVLCFAGLLNAAIAARAQISPDVVLPEPANVTVAPFGLNNDFDLDMTVSVPNIQISRLENGLNHAGLPFFLPGWDGAWDDRTDRQYRQGISAIDRRDWEEAIRDMEQSAAAKGSRADAAYYWKAYAEAKLGRSKDALATLAALARTYPASAWIRDAKALEVEVRARSGQPVSPDSEGDEDLKLLAINGLMHSDPARATPLVAKVVEDPKYGPKLRARALFVLARSNAPEAKQTVTRLAEGGGNPDLQIRALEYLAATEKNQSAGFYQQVYKRAADTAVKDAVLRALFLRKDEAGLAETARTEQNPELRRKAVQYLGALPATDALTGLYRSETNTAVKRQIIDSLFAQGNAKQLVSLARNENDEALKRTAVERLAHMKNKEASDYLLELLNK